MGNMVLGTCTFDSNPSGMTFIQKDRDVAHKKTYSSVALFSWGASYVGKTLELSWDYMTTGQYDDLRDIFEADAEVVFDPQDGESKTFNVEVLALNGEYYQYLEDATGNHRKSVTMQLLIMSEAT